MAKFLIDWSDTGYSNLRLLAGIYDIYIYHEIIFACVYNDKLANKSQVHNFSDILQYIP